MKLFHCILLGLILSLAQAKGAVESVPVASVWAGHPVNFALLTHPPHQYVCYYDADRRMTVAGRLLTEDRWTIQPLPSVTNWDLHRYLTMAVDRDGFLHVTGNMHNIPLNYYRMTKKGDVTSLVKEPMTGADEERVTYPRFFKDKEGNLLFMHRDGGSGNGRRFVNIYDTQNKDWSRYLDTPLLDGTGASMNAYPKPLLEGPDGWYHLMWVWRDTGRAATCHDLSYAKSRDLKNWFTAGGEKLTLPITPDHTSVVLDPAPSHGGLINMGLKMSFDDQGRIVISYHKYDQAPPAKGNSQLFNARWETDHWNIVQTSHWKNYRWEFDVIGSIPNEVQAGGITVRDDGMLEQTYQHATFGKGTWTLSPESLAVVSTTPAPAAAPHTSKFFTKTASDLGASGDPDVQYSLTWETWGHNKSKPLPEPWPKPTQLNVIKQQR
jgi:hypothetical protein